MTCLFIFDSAEQAETSAKQMIARGIAPMPQFHIHKGEKRWAIKWCEDAKHPERMRMPRTGRRRTA